MTVQGMRNGRVAKLQPLVRTITTLLLLAGAFLAIALVVSLFSNDDRCREEPTSKSVCIEGNEP
jgi:hypothetical protein